MRKFWETLEMIKKACEAFLRDSDESNLFRQKQTERDEERLSLEQSMIGGWFNQMKKMQPPSEDTIWENRRYDIAKELLPAVFAKKKKDADPDECVEETLTITDALVNRLRSDIDEARKKNHRRFIGEPEPVAEEAPAVVEEETGVKDTPVEIDVNEE